MQSHLITEQAQTSEASLIVDNLAAPDGSASFSLRVDSSRCVTLEGASGSGKTRLLRRIADLDPSVGSVRIGDRSRESMPAPEWRRLVTYVASESGWWTSPVSAHMANEAFAQSLLADLGLDSALMASSPAKLSSGERQRFALLRAIVQKPRFLLLDEPTSALDEAAILQVEALLEGIKSSGTGLLVVSHHAAQIRRMSDRRYILSSSGLSEAIP